MAYEETTHPADGRDPAGVLDWVSPVDPEVDAAMRSAGRPLVRLLHQMRRRLPLEDDARGTAPSITTRPFRPGIDEDAWLAVNNRAFRWHPDQGGWDRDRLAVRLAEPWVDLDGFLVHESADGSIDGFCWTREHPAGEDPDEPAMGEIFVIAADPSTAGTGLGGSLTASGLDHLAGRGFEVAMLYVEAVNTVAIRLYERLGFVVHHSDAAYTR